MSVDLNKVSSWEEMEQLWKELKDTTIALENKHILTLNRLKAYQDKMTPVPPKQVKGDITCYCAVCSSPVIIDDNFCHNCGQKLREVKPDE